MALVLRSMWQWMFSGTEGQMLRAVVAALLSTAATVSADSSSVAVVQAVEHRPVAGRWVGVRVELGEVDAQVLDRLVGQRERRGSCCLCR